MLFSVLLKNVGEEPSKRLQTMNTNARLNLCTKNIMRTVYGSGTNNLFTY